MVAGAYEQNIRTNLGETRKQDKKVKQKKNRKKAKKPVVEINGRKDRKVINEYHTLNKKLTLFERIHRFLGKIKLLRSQH